MKTDRGYTSLADATVTVSAMFVRDGREQWFNLIVKDLSARATLNVIAWISVNEGAGTAMKHADALRFAKFVSSFTAANSVLIERIELPEVPAE